MNTLCSLAFINNYSFVTNLFIVKLAQILLTQCLDFAQCLLWIRGTDGQEGDFQVPLVSPLCWWVCAIVTIFKILSRKIVYFVFFLVNDTKLILPTENDSNNKPMHLLQRNRPNKFSHFLLQQNTNVCKFRTNISYVRK